MRLIRVILAEKKMIVWYDKIDLDKIEGFVFESDVEFSLSGLPFAGTARFSVNGDRRFYLQSLKGDAQRERETDPRQKTPRIQRSNRKPQQELESYILISKPNGISDQTGLCYLSTFFLSKNKTFSFISKFYF